MHSHLKTQTGSVTAEFAVVLPAVLLVACTLIGGLALGALKIQTTYASGVLARASGRGEDLDALAKSLGVTFKVQHLAELVCVRAIRPAWFTLDEKSCTRKGGL